MSDDGRDTLVLIAMIGNVFSPRYARARKANPSASPLPFCAFHVALGGTSSRFALTETDRLTRSESRLGIGASSLELVGDRLVARIDERTAFGRRLCGEVEVELGPALDRTVVLDEAGHHRWTPIAPASRAHVRLHTPNVRFSGHAYVDSNDGDSPLERTFSTWSWARLTDPSGQVIVQYDTNERSGLATDRSFLVDGAGIRPLEMPALHRCRLPRTLFALTPSLRLDGGGLESVKTMQDAPFYGRALVRGRILGRSVCGVHEWLDLHRFENPWVQRMIPYRMRNGFPRAGDP